MPDRMFVGIAQFVFLLRERRDPFTGGQVLDAISIYVPRREDDIRGAISTPPNWLFQFTSPQGGTTRGNQIALIVGVISIHVSTRGTTIPFFTSSARLRISIHIPTRGTTGGKSGTRPLHRISIHVPTRGTTAKYHKYI